MWREDYDSLAFDLSVLDKSRRNSDVTGHSQRNLRT